MIIERPEEIRRINEVKKWTLIYGRRKTGKTFIVNNFIKYDEYFFVKTDKSVITKNSESISYETFIEILKRGLEENKVIIVDEFHRLSQDFFDLLHYLKKSGRLILISSTLFLSKKLLSGKSALLGLFAEIPISLISLKDTLNALSKFKIDKKDKLELAILMREPIAIDYFDKNKDAKAIISSIVIDSIKSVPAMIGEIFSEEERSISSVYEGVLRAVSIGKINSGEISSYLFSKKLIKKDDPSIIQQYLNNLISFGILKRIEIFNKKRFVYKLSSPLAKIFYYLDEKYNISERKLKEEEINPYISEILPRLVEDNVREFFADENGLRESIIENSDFDIDGYLLKFKNPEISLEVKWKKLNKEDIAKAENNLSKIIAKKKILFVPDKKGIISNLEVLDVGDLVCN